MRSHRFAALLFLSFAVLELGCGGGSRRNDGGTDGPSPDAMACTLATECDDAIACTVDDCNTSTSSCTHVADDAACNDSNDCTSDTCGVAGCEHANVNDNMTCMNGAGSTGTCQTGVCEVACEFDVQCDDGVACTSDICNTTQNVCENTSTDSLCDDGIACTNDTCHMTADCQFAPDNGQCDDANPCTSNTCGAAGCTFPAVTPGTLCQDGSGDNGLCMGTVCTVECDQDSDCSDNDMCTGTETCNLTNGQCVAGAMPNCDDGFACTTDSCSPTTGCGHVANNGMCDDSGPCTTDTCSLTTGCVNTPNNGACNDSNTCTTDTCGSNGICSHPPTNEGNPCMVGPTAGICVTGVCDTNCMSAAQCNDGIPCTTDSCNTGNGQCEHTPNNGMCGDGSSCNTDTCDVGMGCLHSIPPGACNDNNPCTADTCGSPGCMNPAVMPGTLCQNGMGDNGLCMGTVCDVDCDEDSDCNDNSVCTGTETCNLSNGQCVAGTMLNCNDGVACTTDGCNMTTGCTHVANNGMCNDSISCTTDTCSLTLGCQNMPNSGACDDMNPCTSDVCSQTMGCMNPSVMDGTICPAGTCMGGMCQTQATVFRVSALSLRDPHLYLNASPFSCTFCDDITNVAGNCNSIIGVQMAPAINPALNTGIAMDGTDADMFLDLSFMLSFSPLVQNGNDGSAIRMVDGNCTNANTCVPRPAAIMNVNTTITTEAGGSGATCLAPVMNTAFANTWADGMMSGITTVTAGTNGCFVTAAATLNINFQISGTLVTIPLINAQVAGQFVGNPATSITNGMLRGFLTDTAAMGVNITVPSPLGNVTINLRDQLLPDAGAANGCPMRSHCNGVDPDMGSPNNNSPDARDVDNMACGWWFYINFTATRPTMATGF